LYFPTYQPVSTHKNCFFEKPVSNFVYNVVLSHFFLIFISYLLIFIFIKLKKKEIALY
jgi:hypothetical protein